MNLFQFFLACVAMVGSMHVYHVSVLCAAAPNALATNATRAVLARI